MKSRLVEVFEKVNKVSLPVKKLLVYKTLKDTGLMSKVVGHEVEEHKIDLKGKVIRNHHYGHPDLEDGDATVHARWIELQDGDLKKLDDWENEYDRKVINHDGEKYYYFKLKPKYVKS